MTKRVISYLFTVLSSIGIVSAQELYKDEIYTSINVTKNVVYGKAYDYQGTIDLLDLKMDIYSPDDNDSLTNRPVIIFAHSGSFLHKGEESTSGSALSNKAPFGDKEDSACVEICKRFAKRGWVAASIDYTLGWNPTAGLQSTRAQGIILAAYLAMQDMKSAVRYFRSNADSLNIDPYRVVAGGTNSGGYMAVTLNSLDDESEFDVLAAPGEYKFWNYDVIIPARFVNVNVVGGLDGDGGKTGINYLNHPGYSSKVQAVLNLGGAVADSAWLEGDEAPVINFHGSADDGTYPGTAVVTVSSTGQDVVEVSGSQTISEIMEREGVYDKMKLEDLSSMDFPGDTLTYIAKQRNSGGEGYFAFLGQTFEPWGWYDSTDCLTTKTVTNSCNAVVDPTNHGFQLSVADGGKYINQYATPARGKAYIDTVMGYFMPRVTAIFATMDATDSARVDSVDRSWAVGIGEIAEVNQFNIEISPNPVTNLSVLTAGGAIIEQLQIFTLEGKEVFSARVNNQSYVIDRKNFENGLYLAKIMLEGNLLTKKLIFR